MNPIGILGAAFRLRDGERDLSATWLEHCGDARPANVHAAVNIIRKSSISPTAKSGFAIGQVEPISAACLTHGAKLRIIHEPEDDNVAHAAVHRWPEDDDQLYEEIAADIWNELVLNSSVP